MCTVLLAPGANPIAVDRYIISYILHVSARMQSLIQASLQSGLMYNCWCFENKTNTSNKLRAVYDHIIL